jgi:hypothetical protein
VSTNLDSSAVQNNSPSLPLVGLSNAFLCIVCIQLRDTHSWKTVDIDSSVGIDDVCWLGNDTCCSLLASREFEVVVRAGWTGAGRGCAAGWCIAGSEDVYRWCKAEASICGDGLDHCEDGYEGDGDGVGGEGNHFADLNLLRSEKC